MNTAQTKLFLWIALIGVFIFSLSIGSIPLSIDLIIQGLKDGFLNQNSTPAMLVWHIRLPRTLLAMSVGAALAMSGAALQGLLRNPLADPALIGVSQGAALAAAAAFYFSWMSSWGHAAPAVAGMLGALLALLLMLLLCARASSSASIVLAGLVISTIAGSALTLVLYLAPNPFAMQELIFWLLGSVAERTMPQAILMVIALIVGASLIKSQQSFLYALSLGESIAQSLGYSTTRQTRIVLAACAVLVGVSVSIAGSIGFVGLLVPHILRSFFHHRPDQLLVPSALLGAILVCLADISVRHPLGQELPLGVMTSLLGCPLLAFLVWKGRPQWN